MTKKLAAAAAALVMMTALAGCGQTAGTSETASMPVVPVSTAQPDPDPPVEKTAAAAASQEAEPAATPSASWLSNSGTAAEEPTGSVEEVVITPSPTPEATAVPTPEATAVPTPVPTETPAPTPLPLRAGTYEGSDGSVLTVQEDGTCTYETTLSGTVNGSAMSGRITFHGTVENGEFSFTKVTYLGLDVTAVARNSGYDDASYWEQAAAIIYSGAF
jgi:hypothetical protein